MDRTVGCRVSDELEAGLKKQARMNGQKVSDVLKSALEFYLTTVAGEEWRVLDDVLADRIEEQAKLTGRQPIEILHEAVFHYEVGDQKDRELMALLAWIWKAGAFSREMLKERLGPEGIKKADAEINSMAVERAKEIIKKLRRNEY